MKTFTQLIDILHQYKFQCRYYTGSKSTENKRKNTKKFDNEHVSILI